MQAENAVMKTPLHVCAITEAREKNTFQVFLHINLNCSVFCCWPINSDMFFLVNIGVWRLALLQMNVLRQSFTLRKMHANLKF